MQIKDIKVGQEVVFCKEAWTKWKRENNKWYEDFGLSKKSILIVKNLPEFGLVRIKTPAGDMIRVSVAQLTPYDETRVDYMYEDVLDKIKYLNKRFAERKVKNVQSFQDW